MRQHFETLSSYLPTDLNGLANFGLAFLFVSGVVVFRYFLMVLPFHQVFYRWRPRWSRRRQIYPELPGKKAQIFEIKWSLMSSVIFGLAGALMGWLWQNGYTLIYLKFDQFGWFYYFVSPLVLAFIHDTYFYWAHRWLHQPKIYKRYHSVHHASLRPSPWASFSFHPVESVINAAIIPLIVLVLPLHPTILLFHLTLMTLTAITNHLGFELLPRGSARHWLGRWLISGLHHAQHHRYYRQNFALFFTFWDVWCGTENPEYASEFDKLLPGGR